jgi:hypothetical protein
MADLKTPTGEIYTLEELQNWALGDALQKRGIDRTTYNVEHMAVFRANVGMSLTILNITPIAPKPVELDSQTSAFPVKK